MPDKVFLTAPIAKTVVTPDNGREVWGFATLERVDKTGEIADFEGTVQAFQKWSSEIEKRTQGKSKGNVRLMHGATTAGKAIHWEPTETTVEDDDGNQQTVKAIWTGAYVPPTKPDIIKDIDEGILSAFSIGGSYAKRWWDDAAKAFRYIPELSEYSLVDNPAVPGADFVNVIAKADGPWNKSERNIGGESVSEESLEKKSPAGSYEELSQRIEDACTNKFKQPGQNYWDGYVVATFPDHVIVRDWANNAFWQIPYTVGEGNVIELGEATQVDKVESYVPVETMKMVKAAEDERKKLHDEAEARAKKYGISFKEGKGHLTAPKGKPTDPEEYGDPVNYAYPIDSSRIKAAVSYFNQDGQKDDGGYSEEEWAKIGKRIAEAAKKHEGGDYAYKDGKIETPSEQPKGSEKSVTAEDLQKAAEAAGVSMDQLLAVFKALNPEESTPPPTNVTSVDGDGDNDNNKEFPNPVDADIRTDQNAVESEVEQSEKESGVALKGEQAQDLEKAGKAVSKQRMMHMQHAINHMKAAMDGTDYGPEHHMQVENETAGEGTNSGMEAPEVTSKSFTSMLNKSVGDFVSDELSKALQSVKSEVEALVKGLPNVEAFDALKKQMDETTALVKAIHDTPQPGGVVLGGGNPNVLKLIKSGDVDMKQVSDEQLEEFVKSIKDPMVRDGASQELAKRRMSGVFGNGGNA